MTTAKSHGYYLVLTVIEHTLLDYIKIVSTCKYICRINNLTAKLIKPCFHAAENTRVFGAALVGVEHAPNKNNSLKSILHVVVSIDAFFQRRILSAPK